MNVLIQPAWSDNYIYVVHDGQRAAVIDPCDALLVTGLLTQHGLSLEHILVTHHHGDHTSGVAELCSGDACSVMAPVDPRIIATDRVGEGDEIMVAGGRFQVLSVPGHTRSHVAFYSQECGFVFTGDALFVAGCGRVFEGTAAEMWGSLKKLRDLPDSTQIYCGHNYTVDNLAFALHLEPDNQDVQVAHREAEACEREGKPTVPSTIEREKRINPFFRCDDARFLDALSVPGMPPDAVFEKIRGMKNKW